MRDRKLIQDQLNALKDLSATLGADKMPVSAINAMTRTEELLASEGGAMNVYLIETSGPVYHFAGPTMISAIEAAWEGWSGYDDLSCIASEGFSISLLEPEHWPETYNDDGAGNSAADFAALVARTKEAGVLTCSDWP